MSAPKPVEDDKQQVEETEMKEQTDEADVETQVDEDDPGIYIKYLLHDI